MPTTGWRELLKDIVYGAIIPLIISFLIIAFPLSQPFLSAIDPALIGIFVFGFEEQILIVAVPMLFGLIWNRWAGGASGFLLGSIYALWYAIYGIHTPGWSSDISLLGYCISGMLIGYIAGALNKGSHVLFRMLFSGVLAGIFGALFLWVSLQLSPFHTVVGSFGFFITITPRITFGIVIPVFAKVFHRFGVPLNEQRKRFSSEEQH